jgi:hypothetical protein
MPRKLCRKAHSQGTRGNDSISVVFRFDRGVQYGSDHRFGLFNDSATVPALRYMKLDDSAIGLAESFHDVAVERFNTETHSQRAPRTILKDQPY